MSIIKSKVEIKRSEVSRSMEIFCSQNDMIQNKINNLASIAIFFLYKKMLSGHLKVKIVLGTKFQDKTKSKWCDSSMQKMIVGKHYCYNGKHLFCNMFHVIWAFSKRHASEAPPITLKWQSPLIIPLDIASINELFFISNQFKSNQHWTA